MDRLVAFLQTGVMWKLHGLFRACALTGQKQAIDITVKCADKVGVREFAAVELLVGIQV